MRDLACRRWLQELAAVALCLTASVASALTTSHIATDAELNQLLHEKSFVAEGRIGNRATSGTFEIDIGADTSPPAQTAQYVWPNGVDVPFTVSYGGTVATLAVGAQSVEYTPLQLPGGDFYLRTRANKAGASIRVSALALDGVIIPGESHATFGTNGGLDILRIQGADLAAPFTLTGVVRFTWNAASPPANSNLAFQVKFGVAPSGTPPTVGITSPVDGALFGASPVGVSGTVAGTEPVAVAVNGIAAAVTDGTWTASVPMSEGANTLTATATNAFGTASDEVAVTLDTTPPVVVIETPPDGLLTADGSVVVTGTVVDASPIASFTVSGVDVPLEAGAFTTTIPLAPGANPITAEATDAAGNTGSDAVAVTRGEAPTISISAPADGSVTPAAEISVTGTVGGSAPLAVDVNGVSASVTGQSFTANVPLVLGANALTATATNPLGTATDAVSVTRTQAGGLPLTISITTPPDQAFVSSSVIPVSGIVSDPAAQVSVGEVGAVVSGTQYVATAVRLVEGPNTLVATARRGTDVATDQVTVVFNEPPKVVITSPADGAQLRVAETDVVGVVDDPAAYVDVNGILASVGSGGRFVAPGVPLSTGSNPLLARAVDLYGAVGTDRVEVTRSDDTAGRMRLVLVIPDREPRDAMSGDPNRTVIAESTAEFSAALAQLGFEPTRFDPLVEAPVFGFNSFQVHLFVFLEAGVPGEPVSVPEIARFFSPSSEPLRPIGELAGDLADIGVALDLAAEILPSDFAPNGFARFTLFLGFPE